MFKEKEKCSIILTLYPLYVLGTSFGQLGTSLEDAFDWRGHTLSCFTAGHWYPWNNAGIAMSARVVSHRVSQRSFAGRRKEAKYSRVVLSLQRCCSPIPLGGEYPGLPGTAGKNALEVMGPRSFCFQPCRKDAPGQHETADFKCLLCFIAVINMASKVKQLESCC